jgi:hypothetical protein
MNKKEIYEHLAKIYLDASSPKNKKGKPKKNFRNLFFIGLVIIFGVSISSFLLHNKNISLGDKVHITSERALVLQPSNIIKINFNFEPATKEIYSLNLNKLNLQGFKALGFSCRKSDFDDKITLKIEFTNTANQTSEYYIGNLKTYKWQDYKIALSDFKNITNWSKMSNLSFIIEDWNTQKKSGVVYIDNIRLLQ